MIGRTNMVLGLLLAAVIVTTVFSRVDYSRPNIEILPEMKYSPAYSTYEPNENFANGRTLQAPLSGTIARGHMPLHYAATKEDAQRAGEEILNPYRIPVVRWHDQNATPPDVAEPGHGDGTTIDNAKPPAPSAEVELKMQQAEAKQQLQASVLRGAEIYRVFCVCCHGPNGAGDGPVTQRGFPPPPSLLTGKSPQMKDGQLFHILTFGQGSMAPMAAQISREERWDVINYVRGLQVKAPATPDPVAPPTGAERNGGETGGIPDEEPS